MSKILVADDEPDLCGALRDFFGKNLGMDVECAHTEPEAVRLLMRQHLDLALIDLPLSGSSDLGIAALAADADTPVLLMTGRPDLQLTMQQFDFPHLRKPFTLEALRSAAERAMSDHAGQLARLKASLERWRVNRKAVEKAMREADRLLDITRRRQQLGHWNAVVARTKDIVRQSHSGDE